MVALDSSQMIFTFLYFLKKSQMRDILEYYDHIWFRASSIALYLLDRVQRKTVWSINDPSLTHHRVVVSSSPFYRHYFDLFFVPPLGTSSAHDFNSFFLHSSGQSSLSNLHPLISNFIISVFLYFLLLKLWSTCSFRFSNNLRSCCFENRVNKLKLSGMVLHTSHFTACLLIVGVASSPNRNEMAKWPHGHQQISTRHPIQCGLHHR